MVFLQREEFNVLFADQGQEGHEGLWILVGLICLRGIEGP